MNFIQGYPTIGDIGLKINIVTEMCHITSGCHIFPRTPIFFFTDWHLKFHQVTNFEISINRLMQLVNVAEKNFQEKLDT